MKDYCRYWKALTYAAEKYGDLKRASGKVPRVIHPIRIVSILRAIGLSEYTHESIFLVALFHDLIEDTNTTYSDIESNFGKEVASIVDELSLKKGGDKIAWLESFTTASKEAKLIKMADRIDNLRDMKPWSEEKRQDYARQAKIILKTCGSAHDELANELRELIDSILV